MCLCRRSAYYHVPVGVRQPVHQPTNEQPGEHGAVTQHWYACQDQEAKCTQQPVVQMVYMCRSVDLVPLAGAVRGTHPVKAEDGEGSDGE